jgi:Cytochrome P460
MNRKRLPTSRMAMAFLTLSAAFTVSVALALAEQDKYSVKVPGGLAFSEFRGYEDWQVVGPSETDAQNVIRVILANPQMIKAYREGVPANGKPFPDGSKIAKIEWTPKKLTAAPFSVSSPDTVPDILKEVEFIVKDAKRFPDGHGWGYAVFNYNPTSDTFTPATSADRPPQGNDARCGVACHNLAAAKDYIFTPYLKR